MSLFRRDDVWWYEFWFAGQRIRESTKSASKTVARDGKGVRPSRDTANRVGVARVMKCSSHPVEQQSCLGISITTLR